jgi:hypothetical protein
MIICLYRISPLKWPILTRIICGILILLLLAGQMFKCIIGHPESMTLESLDKHADTYGEEMRVLHRLYDQPCIVSELYATSDGSFITMRDHYVGAHRELAAFPTTAVVNYKVMKTNEQMSESIPAMLVP